MESKNLTKSFGVRLPLDLYMQMLKISTENKITMTDLCLYAIMNSGIPNGELNFKKGGEVDEKYTTEIRRLNEEIRGMQRAFSNLREANMKLEYEKEEILKKLATAERINVTNYKSIRDENQQLKRQIEHWNTYGHPKGSENN